MLAALAVPVTDLRLAPQQPVGRAMFLADRADAPNGGAAGAFRIVALGRDEADAEFLARAWRFRAYRDFPPNLFPTRRQQVEYEAYVCMLVGEGGASVPRTVVAAKAGGIALLVQGEAVGTQLSATRPPRPSPTSSSTRSGGRHGYSMRCAVRTARSTPTTSSSTGTSSPLSVGVAGDRW